MNDQFEITVDCGTDSVRSIIVNTTNENKFAVSVFYYLSCKNGLYVNTSPKQFRQHLKDYIKRLKYTIKICLQQAGTEVAAIKSAISAGTTGSAPVAQQKLIQMQKNSIFTITTMP